jgi:hypothetical protein
LHLVLHLKLWSVQLFLPFIPCHQRDRVDIFVFLFWIRSVWRVSMNGRKNYYWPRLLVKDHLQSLFRVCFVHLCSLDIEIFNLKACFAEKEKKLSRVCWTGGLTNNEALNLFFWKNTYLLNFNSTNSWNLGFFRRRGTSVFVKFEVWLITKLLILFLKKFVFVKFQFNELLKSRFFSQKGNFGSCQIWILIGFLKPSVVWSRRMFHDVWFSGNFFSNRCGKMFWNPVERFL